MLLPIIQNPFNPSTTIKFTLEKDSFVSIDIYNLKGKKIKNLLNGENLLSGEHNVVWHGLDKMNRECASGLYFCKNQNR